MSAYCVSTFLIDCTLVFSVSIGLIYVNYFYLAHPPSTLFPHPTPPPHVRILNLVLVVVRSLINGMKEQVSLVPAVLQFHARVNYFGRLHSLPRFLELNHLQGTWQESMVSSCFFLETPISQTLIPLSHTAITL